MRYLLLILPFLFCCSEDPKDQLFIEDIGDGKNLTEQEKLELSKYESDQSAGRTLSKVVNGINFQFKAIRAVDFISRTGQRVSEKDEKELMDESVFIFELADTNSFKNIFEHPSMVLSQDEVVQYFCGKLSSDLKIEQGNVTYIPNGIQYEGVMGATNNKIRVLTFFKGIDLQKEYIIKYNDPVFNAGLIIIKQKTKHLII